MSVFSRYTLCVQTRAFVCVRAVRCVHTHRNARVRFVELTAVERTSIRVKKGKQRQSKGTNHALRRLGSGENSPSPPLLRLSLLASGITNISTATFPPSRSFTLASSIRDSRDLSPTFANRRGDARCVPRVSAHDRVRCR